MFSSMTIPQMTLTCSSKPSPRTGNTMQPVCQVLSMVGYFLMLLFTFLTLLMPFHGFLEYRKRWWIVRILLGTRDEFITQIPQIVIRAHETQYTEDMECFLQARAQEIVYRGLMVLTCLARPDGTPHSADSSPNVIFQLLGSSLMDLVRKGVVKEEKVDSFNLPVYTMSPQELAAVVEQNGCFSMEIMVSSPLPLVHYPILIAQLVASHFRAGMWEDLKHQFGEEVLDELFDLFCKKCEDHASALDPTKAVEAVNLVVVLRRNAD